MTPVWFIVHLTPCSSAETEAVIRKFEYTTATKVEGFANSSAEDSWDKRPRLVLTGFLELPFDLSLDPQIAEEAFAQFEDVFWLKLDKAFPSREIDGELQVNLPDPTYATSILEGMKVFHPGNRTVH